MNIIRRVQNAIKYSGYKLTGGDAWIRKLFVSPDPYDINEDTALKYSAVWAAVNIISSSVGFLPLVTYKKTPDNSRDRATKHNVYRLLHDRPNPFMSSQTFKETLTSHLLLWGNAYAEIQMDGAMRPVALWPIPPSMVKPVLDIKTGSYYFEVSDVDAEKKVLQYNQVLHLHGLGFDGIQGYSVIRYAADSIGTNIAAEQNAATFFKNDSSPSGLLTTDTVLTKETKEGVEKGWEDKHKGLPNRYRIAVLHSGLKYQTIGIPARDAQLLESRKFGISDIARWFQVPPHMLGDLDRATFSNIEEQGIHFVSFTLQRWLQCWKHEVDYKLFSPSERDVYFTDFLIDMLLRGNSEMRAKVYQIALGGNNNPGYMTVNEVRQRENLPPIDTGDSLFLPQFGGESDNTDLFTDIWSRIINKEIKAINKAAKKPDSFLDWAETFFESHGSFVDALILPAVKACYGSAVAFPVDDYVSNRKEQVIDAFTNGTMNELIQSLQTTEPVNQSSKFIKGKCHV